MQAAPPAADADPGLLRVGVDLTDVSEVATSLATFGDRYTTRIFTAGELADCDGPAGSRARSLAARFAAKEAVLKVLRVTAQAPPWTDIEVVRSAGGWPGLRLHGLAAVLADQQGLDTWALSLTHETQMAAAVVVATKHRVLVD